MRGPFPGCALAPCVGDAAGVQVQAQNVIDEGDALRGLGSGFDR